jgi:hypothetical protein
MDNAQTADYVKKAWGEVLTPEILKKIADTDTAGAKAKEKRITPFAPPFTLVAVKERELPEQEHPGQECQVFVSSGYYPTTFGEWDVFAKGNLLCASKGLQLIKFPVVIFLASESHPEIPLRGEIDSTGGFKWLP